MTFSHYAGTSAAEILSAEEYLIAGSPCQCGEEIPFWLPPKAGLREASTHMVPSQDLALPTELPANGRTMKVQNPDVHLPAPFIPVFHR